MRKPSLYLSFSYSFLLHVFLVVAIIVVNKTSVVKTHKTYMVSIVSVLSTPTQTSQQSLTNDINQKDTNQPSPISKPKKNNTESHPPQKTSQKQSADRSVEDRISEIRAKKRLESLASLRKNIDISDSKRATDTKGTSASQIGTKGVDDYLSLVRTMIMQKWVYPDRIDKNLEAVIAIRIQRDGSVRIVGIEKSSGNRLFDRSALSAINSITSLPKPPEGIEEVGIRFKP